MKETLVQTSSIFSKNRNVENKPKEELEFEEVKETKPLCKTISFPDSDSNIILREFFPDSFHCIIYNKFNGKYFAGQMGEELIYEVPIEKYVVEFVTDKMVVLQVWLDGTSLEESSPLYMILRDGSYKLNKLFDYQNEEDSLRYDKESYSFVSTETSALKRSTDESLTTYFYKDGSFSVQDGKALFYENTQTKTKILLADETGSYIGYYLPINSDGTVNLHGRKFKMVQRLTLTLAVAQEVESGKFFLLTCVKQMLLDLENFGLEFWEHISILNGVAMVMDYNAPGTILNVFTPNHQRIILEPKYKVNDTAFGNGLYFEKDNVLLLDNGSLIFTERIDKNTVGVKGNPVTIPTTYYGDV